MAIIVSGFNSTELQNRNQKRERIKRLMRKEYMVFLQVPNFSFLGYKIFSFNIKKIKKGRYKS